MLALTPRLEATYNHPVMLDCLPDQIEPVSLAEAGRSFRGEVAVKDLARLADVLAARTGHISVEMALRIDEHQVRSLTGKLNGNLKLVCQRCLGKIEFPLNLRFQLGIVRSETEAEELPEGYEVLLADGNPIALSRIVEDEIILALPIIPKHEDASLCKGSAVTNKPELQKANPFAVLKQLNSK